MVRFLQFFTNLHILFLSIVFIIGCAESDIKETNHSISKSKELQPSEIPQSSDDKKKNELISIIQDMDRHVSGKKSVKKIKTNYEDQAIQVINNYYSNPDVISLCKAASENNITEVQRLLAKGVDINTKGIANLTPLFFALREGRKETFLYMLKKGADPNVAIEIDQDLEIAKKLEFIYLYGVGSSVTSHAARWEDDPEWLEIVLKHGGDPNVVAPISAFGRNTPLYNAIDSRNLKNVELLIKAGANINHLDDTGGTPVMSAASSRLFHIASTLLQAGADWKVREKNGLDLAEICYMFTQHLDKEYPEEFEYNKKVLEFLKNKGIDLEATKEKVLKHSGIVYDVIEMECIYYETETSFGKIVKRDPYISEGWKRVVLTKPVVP